MQRTQERIDRIAEYKIQRRRKNKKDIKKNLEKQLKSYKSIAGQIGGINGAEYLIRNYGLEGAKEQAIKIQNLTRSIWQRNSLS